MKVILTASLCIFIGWLLGVGSAFVGVNAAHEHCIHLSKTEYEKSQLHRDLSELFDEWVLPEGVLASDLATEVMIGTCFMAKVVTW